MHHIPCFADAFQNRGCLRAAEIVEADLGQQGRQRVPIPGLQTLADSGGADGLAVGFFAGILSGIGLQRFVMLHNRIFTCIPDIHNPS